VLRLAEEAKTDQQQRRCRSLSDQVKRQLQAGEADAVAKLMSGRTACSDLAPLYSQAADLIYEDGVEAYKKSQLMEALQKFRSALVINPRHELAAQYVDLTQNKLEVTAERAQLDWQRDFDAGKFDLAAQSYRQLKSLSSALPSASTSLKMNEIHANYRRVLAALVDSFNKACANNARVALENVRLQIDAVLPERSIGEDILANMHACSVTSGCIKMSTQAALARLKRRVDPQFPPEVKARLWVSPIMVVAALKIDQNGDVNVGELQGGNPVVYNGIRNALERWQFQPMLVEGQAQCVDTEIPIRLNFQN